VQGGREPESTRAQNWAHFTQQAHFREAGRNDAEWWAHLVGALRVHPHKHYANYPSQKDRGSDERERSGEKSFLKMKPLITVAAVKASAQDE
jgi:hypothetical protein